MMWMLLVVLFTGNDPTALWEQANQAYSEGRYEAALASYQSLLEQGVHNGPLYYNLGNAYFKTGNLGQAVLHFYRAQRFMPGDADLAKNIRKAADVRKDPIIEGEHAGVDQQLESWLWRLPYELTFWMAASLLLIAGVAGLALVSGFRQRKWLGYVLVCAGITGLLLTGLATVQHDVLTNRDAAVVLVDEVFVLSGPSEQESVSLTLHEGIRVHILDRTDGWYRIRLANGLNGWLRQNTVAVI